MRSHRGGDRSPSPSSRETAPARCRSPPIHIQFLIKLRRNVVILVLGQWILQRRWRRLRRWRRWRGPFMTEELRITIPDDVQTFLNGLNPGDVGRSEEQPSELQSLICNPYAVFCPTKK